MAKFEGGRAASGPAYDTSPPAPLRHHRPRANGVRQRANTRAHDIARPSAKIEPAERVFSPVAPSFSERRRLGGEGYPLFVRRAPRVVRRCRADNPGSGALYPGHLEYLERAYRQYRGPKLGWTYSNIDQIDEQGRMLYKKFLTTLGAPHPKLDLFTCLDRDMFVLPSASLISRQAF